MNKEIKKVEKDLRDISWNFLQIFKGLINEVENLRVEIKNIKDDNKKTRNSN